MNRTYQMQFTNHERNILLCALANHILLANEREQRVSGRETRKIIRELRTDAESLHRIIRTRQAA